MRRVLVFALILALFSAGCFGGDDAPTDTTPTVTTPTPGGNGTAPQAVTLSVASVGAYPANPAFDPAKLEAPARSVVTLTFTNRETTPGINHDWAIDGIEESKTKVIAPGATETITFTLPTEKGELTFRCTVPGHAGRGMVGTFTVT